MFHNDFWVVLFYCFNVFYVFVSGPDYYALGSLCVDDCGEGFFGDDSSYSCEECDSTCASCETSPTYCPHWLQL